MKKLYLVLGLLAALAIWFVMNGEAARADSGALELNTRLWCRWDSSPQGYGQTKWWNWSSYWTGEASPRMYLWYNNSWLLIDSNTASDYGQQGDAKAYVDWSSSGYWFTISTTHVFTGYSPPINYTSYPATWCG